MADNTWDLACHKTSAVSASFLGSETSFLLAVDECLLEAVPKRSAQRANSCDVPSLKTTLRP